MLLVLQGNTQNRNQEKGGAFQVSLRLGAATYTYLWDLPIDDAIRRLAGLGFRHVELMAAPPHLWPRDVDRLRREQLRNLCNSLGVEIVSINPTFLDLNLASPNPGIREESIRQLQEAADLASDLGAKVLVSVSGQRHPLIAPSQQWLWNTVKESIHRCLEHCVKRGIHLGLENGWTVINRAQQMVQMAREIDNPSFGIVYDVANAAMVHSPTDGLKMIGSHLIHVHLSDTDYRTWKHNPVGDGVVNFSQVAQTLREIGYEGVSILEITHPQDSDGAMTRSAESLEYMGWRR